MAEQKKKRVVTEKDMDKMNMIRRAVSPNSTAGKLLARKKKTEKAGK